jgi:hypothetical protein
MSATAFSRLAPEIWDEVFNHLMPIQRVSLSYYWTGIAPVVDCASNEEDPLKQSINALARTPHLLFPRSRHRYWCALLRNATWMLQIHSHDNLDSAQHLIRLEDFFGCAVRKIVAVIDTLRWYGSEYSTGYGSDEVPLTVGVLSNVTELLHGLKGIQQLSIAVESEVDGDGQAGWMESEFFALLLDDTEGIRLPSKYKYKGVARGGWIAAWKNSAVPDLQVLVRIYNHNHLDGHQFLTEENITAIWTHGLLEECREAARTWQIGGCEEEEARLFTRRLAKCRNRAEDRVLVEDGRQDPEESKYAEGRGVIARGSTWHCTCGMDV